MIIRKIIGTFFMILFTVFCLATITGRHEIGTRTYNGSQTFATITEAIAFQSNISNEAAKSGAQINSIELTKQSPPTVTWSVVMPATNYDILGDESLPFKYGDQWYTPTESRNWNIFGFIFMPSLLVLLLTGIFSRWGNNHLSFRNNHGIRSAFLQHTRKYSFLCCGFCQLY